MCHPRTRCAALLLLAGLTAGFSSPHAAWTAETAGGAAPWGKPRFVARWGDNRFRHAAQVTCITLLPDGKRALTSAEDCTARIWDLETGRELQRFTSDQSYVWATVMLPGEKQLLMTWNKSVSLRDVETRKEVANFKCSEKETVFRLCLMPGAKQVVACVGDGGVKLWDIASAKVVREFSGFSKSVYSAAATPDGKLLAAGGSEKTIRVWDVATGECRHTLSHTETVYTLAALPDSKRLASCSADKTIKLWDLQNGKELWSVSLGSDAKVISVSPDGQRLAAGADKAVVLLNTADGKELSKFPTPEGTVWPVAFTADGARLYAGGDGIIGCGDLQTGKRIFPPPDAPLLPSGSGLLALAGRAQKILSAGHGKKIHAWDLKTGKVSVQWDVPDDVRALKVSPDGRKVLASCDDRKLRIWDVESGKCLHELAWEGYCRRVAFAADGTRVVAVTSSNTAVVLNPEAGAQPLATLQGHTNDIEYLAVSPDGLTVATASEDGSVRFWNLATGAELKCLVLVDKAADKESRKDPNRCVFLPDGRRLLTVSRDNTLRLWRGGSLTAQDAKPEQLQRWIANLNSDEFAVREQAVTDLIGAGEGIVPLLDKLDTRQDAELAMRVQQVRQGLSGQKLPSEQVGELKLDRDVSDLVVFPDGQHWAAAVGDGAVTDVVIGEVTNTAVSVLHRVSEPSGAASLILGPDGTTLYVGNRDSTISVYSLEGSGAPQGK